MKEFGLVQDVRCLIAGPNATFGLFARVETGAARQRVNNTIEKLRRSIPSHGNVGTSPARNPLDRIQPRRKHLFTSLQQEVTEVRHLTHRFAKRPDHYVSLDWTAGSRTIRVPSRADE